MFSRCLRINKLFYKPTFANRRYCSTIKEEKSYNYDALEEVLKENNALKLNHTESVFAEHDVRNLRFLNRVKMIDPIFAINEISKVKVKVVDSDKVYCDGGDDFLGHPKVYINLDKPGPHICGYCGLRFEKSNAKLHH